MTTWIRLAEKETNDLARQNELRNRALRITSELSEYNGVATVMLSGSVARGPVGPSSDLDLHVIASANLEMELPEWSFGDDGTVVNIHTIPENRLEHAWNWFDQSLELAHWFFQTSLGDELNGCEVLFEDPSSEWSVRLPKLLARRIDPDVAAYVASLHADKTCKILLRAAGALEEGAVPDSQQEIRWAVQSALVALLISRGWVIRGSKKRIEIAQSFLPDPTIERIIEVALNVISLQNMSAEKVLGICDARLSYRSTVREELVMMKAQHSGDNEISQRLARALQDHEQHNLRAFDYYGPMIREGLILGPINHIRALSSFSRIPNMFCSLLGGTLPWPIRSFLGSGELSDKVKQEWLELADLKMSKRDCNDYSAVLVMTVEELRHNITP